MNLVFMGTPAFAVPSLRALVEAGLAPKLVVTQPSARRKRRGKVEHSPLGDAALELGLELMESEKISAEPEFSQLEAANPELIVVVAFGQILRKNVLALPRHGSINLHPSMLPHYRGAAPIQRAILDGIEESGISIIQLVSKLDAGPILAQAPFLIAKDENAEQAGERAALLGAQMIVDVAQAYANATPPTARPQDDAQATYAHMLSKEDGLIDFDKPASRVWDQIRGVTPWPRAYTFHHSHEHEDTKRLIVHAATPTEKETHGKAGTILGISEQGIEVACQASSLLLTKLQAEGKPARPIESFIRGYQIAVGDTLGTQA